MINRNLLLLSFQYGIYNSPEPAPFYRVEMPCPEFEQVPENSRPKDSPSHAAFYTTEKAMKVILKGDLGPDWDITGIHHGELHLDDISCTACHRPLGPFTVVAKFGFGKTQKERLVRENYIYNKLHRRGVKGIPDTYGLFYDLDWHGANRHGPFVLLMSYAGNSMDQRAHTLSREMKCVHLTLN